MFEIAGDISETWISASSHSLNIDKPVIICHYHNSKEVGEKKKKTEGKKERRGKNMDALKFEGGG